MGAHATKGFRSLNKKTARELWESSEASSDSIFSFSSSAEEKEAKDSFPSTEEERKDCRVVYTALSKFFSEEELPDRWKEELKHPRGEVFMVDPTPCAYYFRVAALKRKSQEKELREEEESLLNRLLTRASNDVTQEIVRLIEEGKGDTWLQPSY